MATFVQIRALQEAQPIIFTHVPKTAGSTINAASLRLVGPSGGAVISTASLEARKSFLLSARERAFSFVAGHFRYDDACDIFPKANYAVAIRHPRDRILSFYFHFLRGGSELSKHCAVDVSGRGFELFYDKLVARRAQTNLMCRYIGGDAIASSAIERLEERYNLVWNADGLQEAWTRIFRFLSTANAGPVPELSSKNVGPTAAGRNFAKGEKPSDYENFLPSAMNERILEENIGDIRLLEWLNIR